ncbi:MAG: phospholipase D family protein [Anderseniella sp.]|nr:phospholipase D family protein [Anderseniella sp.]
MSDPHGAFAARVLLADAAERSLDVQYYIWHGDQTGYLLFEALWKAAERGVRVRLLLDDHNTAGLDATIATLDAHPDIEVRLYNPLVHREFRPLNYLTGFTRVNRRMHNKSFTADNQVTIVGGRNVGNEYFGAGEGVLFADLDVIAVGPVVREVSTAFDEYWNSPSAYPAASLVGSPGVNAAAALQDKFKQVHADPEARTYIQALLDTPQVRDMLKGHLPLEWADTRLLIDDPAKTLDTSGRTDILLLTGLLDSIGGPERSFDLVSPYFVPGQKSTAALSALAEHGVKVRVLTNSLAATDVGVVHAGYARRRPSLLRAGVRLYELKPSRETEAPEAMSKFAGSSAASLHAKTFAVDGRRLFVGSFNFDPRSARLNTEMGLLIDSPALAGRLTALFDNKVPAASYEVRINAEDGELEWMEQTVSGQAHHASEPATSWLHRALIGLLSILPIEWLL